MNPHIFREYDIRGKVPDDLNQETVYQLGLVFGTYYHSNRAKSIALGRDCRLSSPDLRDSLWAGLIDSGVHVLDVGMVPTPLLYFSLHHLEVDGGIQITGSHNPPEYNGFKVGIGKTTIYGEEIQKIREIEETGRFFKGIGKSQFFRPGARTRKLDIIVVIIIGVNNHPSSETF